MSGIIINPYSFQSAATTLSLTFYESRYGSDMGDVDVYVVDTSGNIIGTSVYSASGDDGLSGGWALRTASTPAVSGSFRVAWHYQQTAAVFTGDYAIDVVELQGSTYDFNSSSNSFLTTSGTNTTSSSTALSGALPVSTTTNAVAGQWNRNSQTTPSSNTGPSAGQTGAGTDFYLYCETSSPNNVVGMNFWLFSPVITV